MYRVSSDYPNNRLKKIANSWKNNRLILPFISNYQKEISKHDKVTTIIGLILRR